MWITISFASAAAAGISVIIGKIAITGKNTYIVSAASNTFMLLTLMIVVLYNGTLTQIPGLSQRTWILTVLSGVLQGFSWLFYYFSLRDGSVNLVMAFDKFGIITVMLLSALILGERITFWMVFGSVALCVGMLLMLEGLPAKKIFTKENRWILWAIVSPVLQSAVYIFAKLDVSTTDTTLTTTLRSLVVVLLLWLAVAFSNNKRINAAIDIKSLMGMVLSGATIGISYILMYHAIAIGAVSIITPIIKSSLLITTLFSCVFFKERMSRRGILGFILISTGIVLFLL